MRPISQSIACLVSLYACRSFGRLLDILSCRCLIAEWMLMSQVAVFRFVRFDIDYSGNSWSERKSSRHELQNWKTRSIAMRINSVFVEKSKGKKFMIDKLEKQQQPAATTTVHELWCSVPSIRTNGFSRCPNHSISAATSLDHCYSRSPFPFSLAVYKFKCSIYYKYLAQWIPLHFSTAYFHSPLLYEHTCTHTRIHTLSHLLLNSGIYFCTHTHFYVTVYGIFSRAFT